MRPRRNPRIERRTGPLPVRPALPPPRRVIAVPAFHVLVVPDAAGGRLSAHDRQLLGAAHMLAGNAGAVGVLAPDGIENLGTAGADRVFTYTAPDGYDPAGLAQTVMAARAQIAARHVLFADSADGGDLARRVAALANENLDAAVEALTPEAGIRACTAGRCETRLPLAGLISLAVDRVSAYSGPECEARALPALPPDEGEGFEAHVEPADPASLALTEAAFVVAAGNGVTDLAAFAELVRALGGTPGASRILCDAGKMPREAQVGASGSVLQSDCYLALGISGAPQHLAGIAGVHHVIAVNTDLHAAMVARATLAVIADAGAVTAALLRLLGKTPA